MMKVSEAVKALEEGKALATDYDTYRRIENGEIVERSQSDDGVLSKGSCFCFSVKDIINKVNYEIYKEPVLTASEADYLLNIIRPFRKNCKITIEKDRAVGNDEEWICIWFYDSKTDSPAGMANLPQFKTGEMYEGMEVGRVYMPEDLGL